MNSGITDSGRSTPNRPMYSRNAAKWIGSVSTISPSMSNSTAWSLSDETEWLTTGAPAGRW